MLLPKKDERYRRRGIKVEPKWLGKDLFLSNRALLKLLPGSKIKSEQIYPPQGGGVKDVKPPLNPTSQQQIS